jgi:hypothetical protein
LGISQSRWKNRICLIYHLNGSTNTLYMFGRKILKKMDRKTIYLFRLFFYNFCVLYITDFENFPISVKKNDLFDISAKWIQKHTIYVWKEVFWKNGSNFFLFISVVFFFTIFVGRLRNLRVSNLDEKIEFVWCLT